MEIKTDEQVIADAEKRLEKAKRDKDRHKKRLDDYYRLVMPWRHQSGQDYTEADMDDIFDNTAVDARADFSAEMLATFTPEQFKWIEPVPSSDLTLPEQEEVAPQIEAYNDVIFKEIRRSNFYSEALESYDDLSHGTVAILIVDQKSSDPIHCEAIPASDILIARGPNKTIGIKAFDQKIYADQIPYMWPKAKENAELMEMIKRKPSDEWNVRTYVARDYSDDANESWNYLVYTGKFILDRDRFVGQGSCPIIIARWMTDSTTCWGIGPGYLQLPNIKTANVLKEMILQNAEYAIDPAYTYDDDGIINMEQGVSPGTYIPRQQGSKIEVLESGSKFDVGYFTQDELREEIKRGFYQDQPEQRGKTPPTAEQWLDEAARAARRMGAPAGRLAREWLYEVYKRFSYLMNKRGKLPAVKLNGNMVVLNPSSPLIKQQKMEEALQVQRFVGVLSNVVGPEQAAAFINKPEAAYFLKDRMGISSEILLAKGDIKAISEQFNQAMIANASMKATPNVMG